MILITAAGGKTGRHILAALHDRGEAVRALARSDRIHERRGDGIETIAGDRLDPSVLESALEGVRAVVHIGPALHPQEAAMGRAVVEGARAAGVERFVQLSVYRSSSSPQPPGQAARRGRRCGIRARLHQSCGRCTTCRTSTRPGSPRKASFGCRTRSRPGCPSLI